MIEFKIISCPDKSQQASYQHLGAELSFGRVEGDMLIDDPGFGESQLRIRIAGDRQATIESLDPAVEVRLNGKAISGAVPLREKDNVTVARTTINFSRLDLGPLQAPEPYVNPAFKERAIPESREMALMEALAHLEQNTAAPDSPPASGAKPPLPPGAGSGPPRPPLPPGAGSGPPKPPLPPRKP